MRSRWVQALICLLFGHHDLCLAAAYGEILPGGLSKELHYCARCGRAIWKSALPATAPPRWADTGAT